MLHKPVNRIVYDSEGKACGVVSVGEDGKEAYAKCKFMVHYMYIYICIHTHIYTCVYVYIRIYVYIFIYTYMRPYLCESPLVSLC
jgi:hypothetical protein